MDSVTTPAPISPLRQRMQHEMMMRGLGPHTQKDYIRHVPAPCRLFPHLLALLRMWWREAKRRGVMFPHGTRVPACETFVRLTTPETLRQSGHI